GKGLSLGAARASASMEAIELFSAETFHQPRFNRLDFERGVDPGMLPLRRHAMFSPELQLEWVRGVDLLTESSVGVPFDAVHLAEPGDSTTPFLQTSNGLASGAVFVEAL